MKPGNALVLRILEFWDKPGVKVGLAFAIFVAFMMWSYTRDHALNPMRASSLGPEWECDPMGLGRVCIKDVKVTRPPAVMDLRSSGHP